MGGGAYTAKLKPSFKLTAGYSLAVHRGAYTKRHFRIDGDVSSFVVSITVQGTLHRQSP